LIVFYYCVVMGVFHFTYSG